MKYYPDLLLLFTLLSVTTMIKAQISIRPYSEWEATQFVAVNGHQPEDYVKPDNNWEILYLKSSTKPFNVLLACTCPLLLN